MANIPVIALNDGNFMPCVGLGFWRVEDADAPRLVRDAVAAGYRSLDTATLYGNERGVGEGVREAGIPREELFITTKVWNDRHGFDETMRAFDESMKRLGMDYVDLYLIHWPVANSEKYVDTWEALIALRDSGKVKSIGVSNFLERHIQRIVDETGVTPAVNQIEYHPYFKQEELVRTCQERGIAAEAWSPLGRGEAMGDPNVVLLSEKYGKTPAQIILRWLLDCGIAVIPKTTKPERMRENAAVFDFSLTPEEVALVNTIGKVNRIGGDPETFTGLDR